MKDYNFYMFNIATTIYISILSIVTTISAATVILVMGIFFQAAAALILTVPIIVPVLFQVGIDPVHFGIIMTIGLAIGQQTPPVATVLITVCTVANLPVMKVFYESRYFLLATVIVLFAVTYIPGMSLYLPHLFLQ